MVEEGRSLAGVMQALPGTPVDPRFPSYTETVYRELTEGYPTVRPPWVGLAHPLPAVTDSADAAAERRRETGVRRGSRVGYLLSARTVRRPVISGIVKWWNRDTSQEVCPHNHSQFVQITSEEAFWPRQGVHGERQIELMTMDQAEFSRRFKDSVVKRAKRRGLLRNAAVALGNRGSPEAVEVLRPRAGVEEDGWVREEIEGALSG